MSLINRIINRLHRVFNKDPQFVSAVIISPTSGQTASDLAGVLLNLPLLRSTLDRPTGKVTISTVSNYVDISTLTLAALVTVINESGFKAKEYIMVGEAPPGVSYGTPAPPTYYSAELVAGIDETLSARGLLEDDYITDGLLRYPTAILYKEFQTYSGVLQEQSDHIESAKKQLYMNSAESDWLDFWGGMYGIHRFSSSESDDAFSQRIVNEVTRPTQNNIALALIVKQALGYDIVVKDAVLHTADLDPADVASATGRFFMDMAIPHTYTADQITEMISNIQALVRKYKAAGTDFLNVALRKLAELEDTVTVDERLDATITAEFTETLDPGPIHYGDGWVYGAPGLVYGTNDAVKEQAVVKLLNPDGSLVSQGIYGG